MEKLNKNKFQLALEYLKKVDFNTLFAQAVLEGKIDGIVYADNEFDPKSFYVFHPYGLSLLFGNENNTDFNNKLINYLLNTNKERNQVEWLQVHPASWNKKISQLLGNNLHKKKELDDYIKLESSSCKIIENTRINFKFNNAKYHEFRKELNINSFNTVPTSKELFNEMSGSVIPKAFWKNAEHFEKQGIGYSALHENKLASTAYSAFIYDNQLEIGIETLPAYYGKGYALVTCSVLIDYCLNNSYEPVWSCRLENTASYKLAQKLGFEPVANRPFYMVKI